MKRLLPIILTVLFLTPHFVYAYTVTTGGGNTAEAGFGNLNPAAAYAGQRFTTIGAGSITSLTFQVSLSSGTATDSLQAIILTDIGSGAFGTSIATSTAVLASSLTHTSATTTFTFSSPVVVTASTNYWIQFARTGPLSNVADYLGSGTNGGASNGKVASSSNKWMPLNPPADYSTTVSITPSTSFQLWNLSPF